MDATQPAAPGQPEVNERIDYNALDNTLGGRFIQAGFIVGYYAIADVTERVACSRAALAAANLAVVVAFNAFDEDPANDLTALVEEHASAGNDTPLTGGPVKTWAVLGGLGAAAVGVSVASGKAHRACAEALRSRGVRAPWTLMGAVAAAGYLAVKELAPAKVARGGR